MEAPLRLQHIFSNEELHQIKSNLAEQFIARAAMQGYKGKTRDKMACEFVCGAAAMTGAMFGGEAPITQSLLQMAFLVSLRGYESLKLFTGEGT